MNLKERGTHMIKRIISLLLTISILSGMTIVLAENEEVTVTSNGIISTENFTDDNVIYNALQNNNGEVSLYSDISSNGITADFDVVLGFDMSSDMYGFDYNGEMAWLNDFKALSEQVPEGTRFSVITNEAGELTTDLNAEIEESALLTYSGDSDIIALLDNCLDTFDETSADRNKVVIATAANISDVSELESKIEELQSYGVIPFVFALNEKVEECTIDHVYSCKSDLEFRMIIADLYLSFGEFNNAQTFSLETSLESDTAYKSDYIDEKHTFNIISGRGALLASIINIYGCVPMNVNNGYDLTSINDSNRLELFLSGDNLQFSEEDGLSEDDKEVIAAFGDKWDRIYDRIRICRKTESIEQVITKNLKRRFPVLIKDNNGTYKIIKSSDDSIEGVIEVFDTYEYLMLLSTQAFYIKDNITVNGDTTTIYTIYNTDFTSCDDTVKLHSITGNGSRSVSFQTNTSTIKWLADTTNTGLIPENKFIKSVRIDLDANGIPTMYNGDVLYDLRLYQDVTTSSVWYYDYLFKATNLGIISGFEDNTFRQGSKVTRAQMLKMILTAADIKEAKESSLEVESIEKLKECASIIPDSEKEIYGLKSEMTNEDYQKLLKKEVGTDGEGNIIYEDDWSKLFMDYALNNNIITAEQYIGWNPDNSDNRTEDLTDTNGTGTFARGANYSITRHEAAYIIYKVLLESNEIVPNIATILYNYPYEKVYDNDNGNYRNVAWKNGTAFSDQMDIASAEEFKPGTQEAIYQLYMNGIMEGSINNIDGLKKIQLKPNDRLTRAECCKLIIACLFHLDEDAKSISANIEGTSQMDTITVDSYRYVIDEIVFDPDNTKTYEITFTNPNVEYSIETTGELDENTSLTVSLIDENGVVISPNIEISGNKHALTIYSGGTGTYKLEIKRTGTAKVGLRIAKTGMSDLLMNKRTGGNFIYVNNPEWLMPSDALSYDSNRRPQYLYNVSGLQGRNILCAEHYVTNNESYKDDLTYYYDVDFYNPNDYAVTININNIGIGKNMYAFKDYVDKFYDENLLDNPIGSLTIEAKSHKLLFKNEWKKNDGTSVEFSPLTYKIGESQHYVFVVVDFSIEANVPKGIAIGTLVDTDHNKMEALVNTTVESSIGYSMNNGIYDSDYLYMNVNERLEEHDLAQKYKGVDYGHLPIVDTNMEYVLTDSLFKDSLVDNETGKSIELEVNQLDQDFFGEKVRNILRTKWSTNTSPYFDVSKLLLNNAMFPTALMDYEYKDSQGNWWLFAKDRGDGLSQFIYKDEEMYDGIYQNPDISQKPHPNAIGEVLGAYYEVCKIANDEIGVLNWYEEVNEKVEDIYINNINMECPEEIYEGTWEKCVTKNARSGYPFAIGLGEWGVLYNYSMDFKNISSSTIKVKINVAFNDSVYIKEEDKEAVLCMHPEQENYEMKIEIPSNEVKNIRFVVLSMVGKSGIEYQVIAEK